MTDAATLTKAAAALAADVVSKAATPQEAVMLCGLIAARICAMSEEKDPSSNPTIMLSLLTRGFNAAISIETGGRVAQPTRAHIGMAI